MSGAFTDRNVAGQRLAEALEQYRDRDRILILALPRGGVPVAAIVAEYLDAELDLMVVRKLGTPGNDELAMGAIASGGERILNDSVIEAMGVSEEALEQVTGRERKELQRRERAYRGDRPWPRIQGATVILVDDGLATGATMRVATDALQQYAPGEVIIAVPVAPPDTLASLREEADAVVCLESPQAFGGVGRWYRKFDQVTDDEVRALLGQAWKD